MAFEGMDVEQVTAIGNQLHGQANQIQSVMSTIDRLIGEAEGAWKGLDAVQFMDWWQQQHRPALVAAEQAISGLGTSAINNANDQRGVSSH